LENDDEIKIFEETLQGLVVELHTTLQTTVTFMQWEDWLKLAGSDVGESFEALTQGSFSITPTGTTAPVTMEPTIVRVSPFTNAPTPTSPTINPTAAARDLIATTKPATSSKPQKRKRGRSTEDINNTPKRRKNANTTLGAAPRQSTRLTSKRNIPVQELEVTASTSGDRT
jgi:hypothetical protein